MTRDQIIKRVRALLAKTVENGATEAEMLAAAEKARAMMDEHDIAQGDLRENPSFSQFERAKAKRDKIVHNIGAVVAEFYGCKYVFKPNGTAVMFGRDSDVLMAEWLLDTLVAHVRRELKTYIRDLDKVYLSLFGVRTRERNGFVIGATHRIRERLRELTPEPTRERNALVATNAALVEQGFRDWLAMIGATERKSRRARVGVTENSMVAGTEAGNRASFSRPVGAGGGNTMIGG